MESRSGMSPPSNLECAPVRMRSDRKLEPTGDDDELQKAEDSDGKHDGESDVSHGGDNREDSPGKATGTTPPSTAVSATVSSFSSSASKKPWPGGGGHEKKKARGGSTKAGAVSFFDPNAMFCVECSPGGGDGDGAESAAAAANGIVVRPVAAAARDDHFVNHRAKGQTCFQTSEEEPEHDEFVVESKRLTNQRQEWMNLAEGESVQSSFLVQGICCASEVPVLQEIIESLPGADDLKVNITSKRVYINHYHERLPASAVAVGLSERGFPAVVLRDGAKRRKLPLGRTRDFPEGYPGERHRIDDVWEQPRSRFVESTLAVPDLSTAASLSPELARSVRGHWSSDEVRAVHFDAVARTVKVEHDPDRVCVDAVANVLTTEYGRCHVVTDGKAEDLSLPLTLMEEEDEDDEEERTAALEEWQGGTLHLHVILSGIFWLVSVIAVVLGGHETHLEYAGLVSVLFGLPSVALKAFRSARRCRFDANCMMVTAAAGALVLGEFEEAASVSFLFAVSELLEARATRRARQALAELGRLAPHRAHLVHPVTGRVAVVPARRLHAGSLVRVRAGDKIAADGIVREGSSIVDESSLTGESVPVPRGPGDIVSGGSVNAGNAALLIETTATVQDSAVSRLARLVEEAQANRSETQTLIDGFAASYTPAVAVMAALMCTVPWFFGLEAGRAWMLRGLIIIVIACPCALTISTPVTYAAGLAAMAQRGIVIKGGATLEALAAVSMVIFDKTGTLTRGEFSVLHLDAIVDDSDEKNSERGCRSREEMLRLLATMEAPSSHPVASALVQAAKQEGVSVPDDFQVKDHKILVGEGVVGEIDGKLCYVGNQRLFERLGMFQLLPASHRRRAGEWTGTGVACTRVTATIDHTGGSNDAIDSPAAPAADSGASVGFVGVEGEGIVGMFCVSDIVRGEARFALQTLQHGRHFEVRMLTGDADGAARAVARHVGLPDAAVHSQLLPEDKLAYVENCVVQQKQQRERLRQEEKPWTRHIMAMVGLCGGRCAATRSGGGGVLFCGDGVNDAPALASATVGVSMGEGAAALAMEMSDVTLMDSNLLKLVFVLDMGRRVVLTIRQNISISLGLKLAVVVLTFCGRMTLLYAIASDVGVMLLVTLNGMKLLPSNNGRRAGGHGCGFFSTSQRMSGAAVAGTRSKQNNRRRNERKTYTSLHPEGTSSPTSVVEDVDHQVGQIEIV